MKIFKRIWAAIIRRDVRAAQRVALDYGYRNGFIAGHAQGHQRGRQEAFDMIDQVIRERGGIDVVAEDVEGAKKRWLQ